MEIITEPSVQAASPARMERAEPKVTKLHPIIGAQVHGIDLSKPLDEDIVRLIRRAWAESIVLVFRNQTLTSADQRRFASYFGPVAERLKPPEKSGVKELPTWNDDLMIISNEVDAAGAALGALGQGEMWFHTDKCYVERPHRFSFLYGIQIPTEGGHTKFASLCEAYDRLPEQLKKDFEGRMVMQGHQYGAGRRIDVNALPQSIIIVSRLSSQTPTRDARDFIFPVKTRCGSKTWSELRARRCSTICSSASKLQTVSMSTCGRSAISSRGTTCPACTHGLIGRKSNCGSCGAAPSLAISFTDRPGRESRVNPPLS